jgi:hypothetical protein
MIDLLQEVLPHANGPTPEPKTAHPICTHCTALIKSAAFSATTITTAQECPETWVGNVDASTTRKPVTPCTLSCELTTLFAAEVPILTEDVYVVNSVNDDVTRDVDIQDARPFGRCT